MIQRGEKSKFIVLIPYHGSRFFYEFQKLLLFLWRNSECPTSITNLVTFIDISKNGLKDVIGKNELIFVQPFL